MNLPHPDQIDGMFTAHYQPIVEMNSGLVVGFEALTRKVAADGSIEGAAPLIEKMEQGDETLYALIRCTLKCVKRDVASLFERYPNFYVSVNIPPVALGTGRLARILYELELTPYLGRLVCELTERQVLTETGRTALARARKEGIRVAVDDFGTGHSGLAQIVGLDLDFLKNRPVADSLDTFRPDGLQAVARRRGSSIGGARGDGG